MADPPKTEPPETMLEIRHASCRFGPVVALDDISLTVPRGQFLTLLGPSGSGKTTLLRIIAGLDQPTAVDTLNIHGVDVRALPAHHRKVATVFQHYGLFPHMNVGENVEYGLLVRGRSRAERRRKAGEVLEMVYLTDKYDRQIHQLSGGERQRVAMARALVTEPDILLLDEPLAALDEKLRQDMQIELLRIHRDLGTTFILVTHSQEEALTMSERIVLLNRGRVEHDGSPQALFETPASLFAARFIGIENVLTGIVESVRDTVAVLRTPQGQLLSGEFSPGATLHRGEAAFLAIRAGQLSLHADQPATGTPNCLPCRQELKVYKGKYYDLRLATPAGMLTKRLWDNQETPEPRFVTWDAGAAVVGPSDAN